MPTYAVIGDLTPGRMGRTLTSEDSERAPDLLGDASFWLSVWVPGLDAAITGGNAELAEAAKLIVVSMVKRALDAPDANSMVEQETVGVFSVRYRAPEGNLFLYQRELDTLMSLMTAERTAAVSYRSLGL